MSTLAPEQLEFIRRRGITRCPPGASVPMVWHRADDPRATEAEVVALSLRGIALPADAHDEKERPGAGGGRIQDSKSKIQAAGRRSGKRWGYWVQA
jgi:hypothetical protein